MVRSPRRSGGDWLCRAVDAAYRGCNTTIPANKGGPRQNMTHYIKSIVIKLPFRTSLLLVKSYVSHKCWSQYLNEYFLYKISISHPPLYSGHAGTIVGSTAWLCQANVSSHLTHDDGVRGEMRAGGTQQIIKVGNLDKYKDMESI